MVPPSQLYLLQSGLQLLRNARLFVHVIFNVIGAVIFTLLLHPVHSLIMWIGEGVNIRMQIAYAHGIFNSLNTLIFLPLIPVLAWIVTKVIPGNMYELEFKPKYLDDRLLATPNVALGQAQHEILRMGQYAREALNDASDFFFERDPKVGELALQKEELINELNRKITDYMVKIHQSGLSEAESEKATGWFQLVNDIERIGDHAENVVELSEFSINNKVEFSSEAERELKEMLSLADKAVERALYALEHNDLKAAEEVLSYELELDELEVRFRKSHIQRLNQNLCSGNSGAVYLDILSNLERIGDHSKNIAQFVQHEEA